MNTTSIHDGRTLTWCNGVIQQPFASVDDAGVIVRIQFVVSSACAGKVKYYVLYTISKAQLTRIPLQLT